MTVELQALALNSALLFVLLALQGSLVPLNQGLRWGLGPRDEPRPASALQGRMARLVANHLEGLAVFAPLVLVAHLAGIATPATEAGAVLYVGARAGVAIAYAAGIPVLRSVFWGAGVVGLVMIGAALVAAG